jgi:hypothetical protein
MFGDCEGRILRSYFLAAMELSGAGMILMWDLKSLQRQQITDG